jgi:hypothetical protein
MEGERGHSSFDRERGNETQFDRWELVSWERSATSPVIFAEIMARNKLEMGAVIRFSPAAAFAARREGLCPPAILSPLRAPAFVRTVCPHSTAATLLTPIGSPWRQPTQRAISTSGLHPAIRQKRTCRGMVRTIPPGWNLTVSAFQRSKAASGGRKSPDSDSSGERGT